MECEKQQNKTETLIPILKLVCPVIILCLTQGEQSAMFITTVEYFPIKFSDVNIFKASIFKEENHEEIHLPI